MTATLVRNPFAGPRPLRTGEPLYGRSAEVEALLSELKARRIVVLHSASGAGKTSLVQAGLIPQMKRAEFDVWRPIRVNADRARFEGLPDGTNPYILSALVSLEAELPAARRRSPHELAKFGFAEYAETRPRRRKRAHQNVALIFDQLDDILSVGTGSDQVQREFFAAIGKALENEQYWALLIVRDELLAKLSLYHHGIPTSLSNTFHLDPLSLDGARQTVDELAGQGGRSFSEVDGLIQELSKVEVEAADGSVSLERSPWVEPLSLQAVCRRLWETTPIDNPSIDSTRLGPCKGVTDALGAYYADAVSRIARRAPAVERELRDAIARALIINGRRVRTRRMTSVPVEQLLAYSLVEIEECAGVQWLELGHERLVAAIQADNEAWSRARPGVVARLQELVPPWSKDLQRVVGYAGQHRSDDEPEDPTNDEPLPEYPPVGVGTVTGDWDATDSSWVMSAALSQARADEPEPRAVSPVTRALFTDVARKLLEASDAEGKIALISVALSTLATTDSKWAVVAMTTQSFVDVDKLIEQLQGVLPQLAHRQAYASIPEREHPTLADLVTALLELGHALRRARGAWKRELLLAAFRASFRPEYHATGMTPHLWDIARRIEYPELRQLEAMLQDHEVGVQIGLNAHEHGAFFVGKLCELGLVGRGEQPTSGWTVVLSEMAVTFRAFLIAGAVEN